MCNKVNNLTFVSACEVIDKMLDGFKPDKDLEWLNILKGTKLICEKLKDDLMLPIFDIEGDISSDMDGHDFESVRLFCKVRGDNVSKELAKEIILATAHFNYECFDKTWYRGHRRIQPLSTFEIGYNLKSAHSCDAVTGIGSIKNYWIHPDGFIGANYCIDVKYPKVFNMLCDAYNLARTFPELDICFYIAKDESYCQDCISYSSGNKLSQRISNEGRYNKVDDFQKAIALGIKVHNGRVTIFNGSEARKHYSDYEVNRLDKTLGKLFQNYYQTYTTAYSELKSYNYLLYK